MKKYEFSQDDVAFIFNLLRQGTIKWSGRKECLQLARKKVLVRRSKKTGAPVYKYHWQCAICSEWFKNVDDMEVDHIVEIGGFTSFNGDWNEMIYKIMPRPVTDHLQCCCKYCHLKKTLKYASAKTKWKRK